MSYRPYPRTYTISGLAVRVHDMEWIEVRPNDAFAPDHVVTMGGLEMAIRNGAIEKVNEGKLRRLLAQVRRNWTEKEEVS